MLRHQATCGSIGLTMHQCRLAWLQVINTTAVGHCSGGCVWKNVWRCRHHLSAAQCVAVQRCASPCSALLCACPVGEADRLGRVSRVGYLRAMRPEGPPVPTVPCHATQRDAMQCSALQHSGVQWSARVAATAAHCSCRAGRGRAEPSVAAAAQGGAPLCTARGTPWHGRWQHGRCQHGSCQGPLVVWTSTIAGACQ